MSDQMLRDRVPPQNLDAERSVLGSMLRLNKVIGDIVTFLKIEDFYTDAHRKIYETITQTHDKGGRPVDLLILAEELRLRGWLEDVGGPRYLVELWETAPTAANAEYYGRIVRDKSLVRGLIDAGTEILAKAYNQSSPAEQLIEEAAGTVFEMASKGMGGSLSTLEQAIDETYKQIDARSMSNDLKQGGLSTGFTELDELTAGFHPNELIIIAARPSVGKCLVAESEIVLDDGSISTIEEVVKRRKARLLTLGDDWRLGWAEPSAFVDDGMKPAFRVTLHSGRRIETTASHPFRVLEGWKPLAELKVGDRVAVPRVLPVEGTDAKASDPHRLPRRELARHLGRFLSAGREARNGWRLDGLEERQARRTRHLLLRFGVESKLREGAEGWSLLARLRVAVPLLGGRGRALATPESVSAHEIGRALRRRLNRGRKADPGHPSSRFGDIRWDRIVSIEPLGLRQVYDLTIPTTHNFIANDVCVHNTAFSLGLARNVLTLEKKPVFFISLEQSRTEIAERLLCSQGKVDGHRLRKGTLTSDDMERLIEAGGVLQKTQLYIDDAPQQGMLRIAANARRLKHQKDISLIIVDYLQLIEPENRRDPRQEQVAQISRRLKFLAKELKIPVIALAQVNRAAEDRQDHRPRLSDLRESGCLSGETLVTMADSGKRVAIRELVGRSGFRVIALNERTMRLEPATMSRAFSTGRKPVFRLTTRLGRTIRATANHPFRAFDGWKRLDELKAGTHLALPRRLPSGSASTMTVPQASLLGHLIGDGCTLPRHSIQYTTREEDLAASVAGLATTVFGSAIQPVVKRERSWYQVYLAATERLTHGKRNPVAAWLDGMGAFGLRSWEKSVPAEVFAQAESVIAAFLRSLWAADGSIRPAKGGIRYAAVYFASSSPALADGVQSLLLRFGINGRHRVQSQGTKGRPQHQVYVSGKSDLLAFAESIGANGTYRQASLAAVQAAVAAQVENTNRDVIPASVWPLHAVPKIVGRGISTRAFQAGLGMRYCGTTLYKQNVSRLRLARAAAAMGGDETLESLATSDVYWDQVASVVPDGEEEVFDLTVPGHHNFVANDIIAHNSIEQDADTVFMLHRPDRYEPGQHEGIIEIIVAKQRNGPTGEVTLAYIKQYLRYEDFKVGTPFGD